MKFRGVGIGIGELASSLRPRREEKNPGELSTTAKANYSQQLGKLNSIFTNKEGNPRMGKHHKSTKSPSRSPKAKGVKALKKVKQFVSEQKGRVKEFGSKVRSGAPSDSESLIGGIESESEGGASRTKQKSGFRFHSIGTLIGLIFVSSAAAFIFIPIVHVIAVKYLWISFGGSTVPLVLSFLGMGASSATLLSLYLILFKLDQVRGRRLDDWTLVICYGVSTLITSITVLISTLHFHDVMEIFGEEFLELLEGYWMSPKFKTGMDQIQIEFHCCGFYSYEDWAEVGTLGEYPPGFVPFSCCSIFTLRPCAHANVPRLKELSGKVGVEKELSIYPGGCKVPMENYYKGMLHWAIIISSTLLTTQILLLILLAFSRKKSNSE